MEQFLSLFTDDERSLTIQTLAQNFFEDKMWISYEMALSYNRKDDLKYFILDEQKCQKFESQFLIFGRATHSGSSYAFYKIPGSKNCDEWPVLVLGDEGGCVMIAKNIFDLMRFWTLNSVPPYIDTDDYKGFYLEFSEDDIQQNDDFKAWILKDYGIKPVNSVEEAVEEIINPAIAMYQTEIDAIFEN
jgi:hypothetical protein